MHLPMQLFFFALGLRLASSCNLQITARSARVDARKAQFCSYKRRTTKRARVLCACVEALRCEQCLKLTFSRTSLCALERNFEQLLLGRLCFESEFGVGLVFKESLSFVRDSNFGIVSWTAREQKRPWRLRAQRKRTRQTLGSGKKSESQRNARLARNFLLATKLLFAQSRVLQQSWVREQAANNSPFSSQTRDRRDAQVFDWGFVAQRKPKRKRASKGESAVRDAS